MSERKSEMHVPERPTPGVPTPGVPTLYVLIGVSGSGKSTYADSLGLNTNLAVVSTDKIRCLLNGSEENQANGGMVFKIAYKLINENLNRGKNVVFDATNTTKHGRKQLFSNIKEPCRRVAVLFTPSIEVALERNKMRQRVVPDHVIYRQYNQLLNCGESIMSQFDDVIFVK